jgi:hypothetical protein
MGVFIEITDYCFRYYQDNVPIILTIKFLLQEKKMKTMSTLLEPRQLLILVLGMPL